MPRESYTEDDIIEAIFDVTDKGISQNHGIPQPTLSGRLRGVPPMSEVTHPAQLLSKSQESREYGWIKPENSVNVDEGGIMAGFAHCSHGLQPLDNGVFNASKAAYRKELQKLAALTDSAPVDKVNFIKAYAKAREVSMTKKNILSGWRVTGNWPISRRKALMHPEIQPEKKQTTPASDGRRDRQVDSDNTPKTSRHIRDLGKNKSPSTKRRYSVISKGFEAQESKIASLSSRVASLEEEVGRLSRGKKRKAIPNPNRKFMILAEALVAGDAISEPHQAAEETEAVEEVIELFLPISLVEKWVSYTNSWITWLKEHGVIDSWNTPMERTSKLHKWEGTAVSEVLTTIGALICMGVHKEKTTRSYWKPPKPGDQRPAHSFIKFISYNKFQLIHRHLRPFDHTKYDETAPIPKIFRPGSHLAVDECMIPYTGKSDDITVIKSKPDPVGFKIRVIAQCGFFFRWIWHVKEKPHGAVGDEISTQKSSSRGRPSKRRKVTAKAPSTEDKSFTPNSTQAVVVALTNMLPEATYHVFMDNLFSSSPLFRNLRSHGFGATATACTNSGIN
ncbi:hypothetical protein FOXYSP1_18861 [Fusarium oxysporum f. sp. phaseoli]